jgi:putative phosphoesterase
MNYLVKITEKKKMTKIGLLSDTHNWLDPQVKKYLADCTEIWHAGDVGNLSILNEIESWGKPIRGVYGNIDGPDIRAVFSERAVFTIDGLTVLMQHIGGYPTRYAPGIKNAIVESGAKLFISGHSHILKVIYDEELHCMHMNPGAAGIQGWHQVKTLITFQIDAGKLSNAAVVELGPSKKT